VPHLTLSWPCAAILAGCTAVAAVVLARARHRRLAAAGRFAREAALLLGLYALWQYAGSFSVLSASGALPRAQWLWHVERLLHLPDEAPARHLAAPAGRPLHHAGPAGWPDAAADPTPRPDAPARRPRRTAYHRANQPVTPPAELDSMIVGRFPLGRTWSSMIMGRFPLDSTVSTHDHGPIRERGRGSGNGVAVEAQGSGLRRRARRPADARPQRQHLPHMPSQPQSAGAGATGGRDTRMPGVNRRA
jgi:hypothetical protein